MGEQNGCKRTANTPHFVRWVKRMFSEELLTPPTSGVGEDGYRRIANAPHFFTRVKRMVAGGLPTP